MLGSKKKNRFCLILFIVLSTNKKLGEVNTMFVKKKKARICNDALFLGKHYVKTKSYVT